MYGREIMDWHPEAHDPRGAIPFTRVHQLAHKYALKGATEMFKLRFLYERAGFVYPAIDSIVDEDNDTVIIYFDHKRWGHIHGVQFLFAGIPIETLCYEAVCMHNEFCLGKEVQTKLTISKDDT